MLLSCFCAESFWSFWLKYHWKLPLLGSNLMKKCWDWLNRWDHRRFVCTWEHHEGDTFQSYSWKEGRADRQGEAVWRNSWTRWRICSSWSELKRDCWSRWQSMRASLPCQRSSPRERDCSRRSWSSPWRLHRGFLCGQPAAYPLWWESTWGKTMSHWRKIAWVTLGLGNENQSGDENQIVNESGGSNLFSWCCWDICLLFWSSSCSAEWLPLVWLARLFRPHFPGFLPNLKQNKIELQKWKTSVIFVS